MAATMKLSKLRVCSDSLTFIAAINNKQQMKEIVSIVRDIQEISSEFDFIVFSHIPRKNNERADSLAKQTLRAVSV
uniref:RNase H type-1 domain-containing protein n=1 Tax=Brassica oleracea var. oleracea TaxID=109376 RepID=A0A0D3A2U9_BRAOL